MVELAGEDELQLSEVGGLGEGRQAVVADFGHLVEVVPDDGELLEVLPEALDEELDGEVADLGAELEAQDPEVAPEHGQVFNALEGQVVVELRRQAPQLQVLQAVQALQVEEHLVRHLCVFEQDKLLQAWELRQNHLDKAIIEGRNIRKIKLLNVLTRSYQRTNVHILNNFLGAGETESSQRCKLKFSEQFRKIHETISCFKVSKARLSNLQKPCKLGSRKPLAHFHIFYFWERLDHSQNFYVACTQSLI